MGVGKVISVAAWVLVTTNSAAGSREDGGLPEVVVVADDTVITRDCRAVVPAGVVIADVNGDGVVHVAADGVTVEFAPGSVLVGGEVEGRWDQLSGVGVSVVGARGVTLRGVHVRGYRVGVLARDADGLTVDGAVLSDNYRQRLGSTPLAEDGADWLFPHRNDEGQWLAQHGAALAVLNSEGVTVRGVRVRRGQNGIVLDRVNHSTIVDNDCSFLSGWGLALWRSSGNRVCSNAFDFCIRGHSEGVYNRGQDSAGMLFFEQCNDNLVTYNSATHGGDGFFGFAGREALGETARPQDADWTYERVGCNDNIFIGNRFTDASAHGWEMTFSEGNVLRGNDLSRNAICGIWGGYSSSMIIEGNRFSDNGGMPYGDEGGAINIEHGSDNVIRGNVFTNNTTAVRLWWDDDGRLLSLPGVRGAYRAVSGNVITGNTITFDEMHPFAGGRHAQRLFRGIWLQDAGEGHVQGNVVADNAWRVGAPGFVERAYEAGMATNAVRELEEERDEAPVDVAPVGVMRPVEARRHLAGREHIVMGAWGPWDHESPMVRLRERRGGAVVYEVYGVGMPRVEVVKGEADAVEVEWVDEGASPAHARLRYSRAGAGVHAYTLRLRGPGWESAVEGVIVNVAWDVRLWAWEVDPLADVEAWRAEGAGGDVVHVRLDGLDFNFQSRGPVEVGMVAAEAAAGAGLGRDGFAIIATATLPLAPGRWRLRTVSDDGVRLFVDGAVLIERWDIHGPTPDEVVIDIAEAREVALRVEHFEKDGWAALSVRVEPED